MPAAQRRGHFLLHGKPYSLQASAYPGFTIPVDPPLARILRAQLKVQRPRHAATRERPVKRQARVAWQLGEAVCRRLLLVCRGRCHLASRRPLGGLAAAAGYDLDVMRIVNDPPTTLGLTITGVSTLAT